MYEDDHPGRGHPGRVPWFVRVCPGLPSPTCVVTNRVSMQHDGMMPSSWPLGHVAVDPRGPAGWMFIHFPEEGCCLPSGPRRVPSRRG